ncbi:MAG: hypothetical protein ACRDOE_05310, partial [Streptosporangiaceae bacterium]
VALPGPQLAANHDHGQFWAADVICPELSTIMNPSRTARTARPRAYRAPRTARTARTARAHCLPDVSGP